MGHRRSKEHSSGLLTQAYPSMGRISISAKGIRSVSELLENSGGTYWAALVHSVPGVRDLIWFNRLD